MATFKAYDIRDTYPDNVNEELFEKIGKSLIIFNKPKKILIGHDMRVSSYPLKEALIKGATSAGIDVIDIGLASTPMVYQASHDLDIDLAIVITASHNPKNYNGMKICKKNAVPISYDTGLKELEQKVKSNKFETSSKKGSVHKIENYSQKYMNFILKFSKPKKKLKVVFDAGNGMGGFIDNKILSQTCELIPLYTELDGNFPNHEANPINEETLKTLKQKVLETKADIGFAFDGDADRIGIIDNKANFIPADIIAAFLINYFTNSHPEELVYSFDLRSSKIVEELIVENKKTPFKTRVGHSYIKELMRKTNSFFSSELSGHFYFWFNDTLVYDSAIRSAIEILNALSVSKKPFSELVSHYRVYFKSPEINFEVKDKSKIISLIKSKYYDSKIEQIDGISIIYGDWWANIRASNTENLLRLNLEANTKEIYEKRIKEISNLITSL